MRILCFGDSNTYGYDPRGYFGGRYDPEDRWPEILASKTHWEIINAGVNGQCIPGDPAILSGYGQADLTVVMLGTNDLLQGASVRETAGRMTDFLSRLRERGTVVLVVPPPMQRGAWVSSEALAAASAELAEAYQTLSRELGVSFVDTREWGIGIAYDGVHFTERGHHTFADRLLPQLGPIADAVRRRKDL